MDLSELEVAAASLLAEQERLRAMDAEMSVLRQQLKDQPRQEMKDRSFYALIGLNYSDPGHENRKSELETERSGVAGRIADAKGKLYGGLSSQNLVVPLDPNFTTEGGAYVFRFRSGATFPKSIEALAEILGIPQPLRLGKVTLYADKVVVTEVDQYFAKVRIVEAFENVRKTVSLKLKGASEQAF